MENINLISVNGLIVIGVIAVVLGILVGFFVRKRIVEKKNREASLSAKDIVENSKKEANTILKEANLKSKGQLIELKNDFEKETRDRKKELHNFEKRLEQREENLDKKFNIIDTKEHETTAKEKNITQREGKLVEKEKELDGLIVENKNQLERLAGLTSSEAKKELIAIITSEAKHEASKQIKEIEDETKEKAENKAKQIISTAIQRYSGEYVTERTVSVVNLPSEDMKGRIIGREGRNIRALEAATGIDFIIDDTPEAIVISGFDPIRREVAKISLERLMSDGRIHPARIEEIVKKAESEIAGRVKEFGERATFDVGIHGIHPELIKLIGRLKYRYSYSQNQYEHALEVSFIAGIIASELGINIKQAKRAGLLHDIGKAIDHEVEGSHAIIGMDLAKKHGESEKIYQAIGAHHEEIKTESVLDTVIQAADSLSGARPGARREMLETYTKRIEDLEKIANDFKGVSKSYAIQAGREVRILVESRDMNDSDAVVLSKDIAKKIESELTYPGQIKITVIRETRAIEFAK